MSDSGARALACLAALLFATAVEAEGPDCSAPAGVAEQAICASPGLGALDADVSSAYADLLGADPEAASRMDQRGWLRARDACPDQDCLFTVHDARLNEVQRELANIRAAQAEQPGAASPTELPTAYEAAPADGVSIESVATAPALLEEPSPSQSAAAPPVASASDAGAGAPPSAPAQASDGSGGVGQTIFFAIFLALSTLSVFVSIKARERYDYPVFMNAWNLVYAPVILLPLAALADGVEEPTKLLFLGTAVALYGFRVWQNMRNTDVLTGLIISICQSFVAVLVLLLYILSSSSKKTRRSRY